MYFLISFSPVQSFLINIDLSEELLILICILGLIKTVTGNESRVSNIIRGHPEVSFNLCLMPQSCRKLKAALKASHLRANGISSDVQSGSTSAAAVLGT